MKAKRNQAGFTLLEMIVVIVIMAMVAGLVLVKQPWHSVGLNTDAAVRALTNGLRLARSRAIAQDRMARTLGESIPELPYPRIEDGAHTMAFIEACIASQASRGWVDVARLPAQ